MHSSDEDEGAPPEQDPNMSSEAVTDPLVLSSDESIPYTSTGSVSLVNLRQYEAIILMHSF